MICSLAWISGFHKDLLRVVRKKFFEVILCICMCVCVFICVYLLMLELTNGLFFKCSSRARVLRSAGKGIICRTGIHTCWLKYAFNKVVLFLVRSKYFYFQM